jgi:hypothetical protein
MQRMQQTMQEKVLLGRMRSNKEAQKRTQNGCLQRVQKTFRVQTGKRKWKGLLFERMQASKRS